jgi:cation diffusion facilitator CzcD-associated flavoprotein CzcO
MVALKEFRDLGFDVTAFEKKNNVGGAWCWSEDAGSTTALRETKLCNNKYSVCAACTREYIDTDRLCLVLLGRLSISKRSVAGC